MTEPLDDLTKRLMERARERREMLTKKMAETSPQRKRSSPLSNSQSQNVMPSASGDQKFNDSPSKRYCMRQEENDVHADTPAIVGVKSRMTNLMSKRQEWFLTAGANDQNNVEVENKAPLTQPDFEDSPANVVKGDRKARLAALASSVSSWEDDLTHVNLKQDVKPKKKWEPPKPERAPVNNENTLPQKPPRTYEFETNPEEETSATSLPKRDFNAKPRRFVSPARGPLEDALSPPKCKENVVSSVTVMLGEKPPNQAATKSPKKTYQSTISVGARSPQKTSSQNTEQGQKKREQSIVVAESSVEPLKSPRKKAARMSDVHEPTKKPVSARLASWKQKVDSIEEKTEAAMKPKVPVTGELTVKKSSVFSDLQDDPLNMSIHSRMNVWEKKIKETNVEHSEPPATPVLKAKGQIKDEVPQNSPSRHLSGSSLHDTTTRTTEVSKSKSGSNIAVSPGKVGSATRGIHDKLEALHQSWASNDIAEKVKQQKEADMELLRNRWKSGTIQETDERQRIDPREMPDVVSKPLNGSVPPPPPAPPASGTKNQSSVFAKSPMKQRTPVAPKREEQRDKMRKEFPFGVANKMDTLPTQQNFETKLQMMGFEMDAENTASVDLTPYKERDKAKKEAALQGKPGEGKPPLPHSGQVVQVEEKKTTTITFDDKEKVSIHRNKVTVPCEDTSPFSDTHMSPVKSTNVTTPKKTATPSIYSLVKKSGTTVAPNSPFKKSPQSSVQRTPQQIKLNRDSFSDDSFESPTSVEPEVPPRLPAVRQASPRKQAPALAQQSAVRNSQLSLTSEYSETSQTDYSTQDDDYSETEELSETSDTQDSEEEDEDSSQDGEVSDLLDEALSESEDEEPVHAPVPVERRSRTTGTPQRNPRPISQPPTENRVSNNTDYYKQVGQRNSAPSHPDKRVKFASDYPSDYTSTQSSAHSSSESEREDRALAYSIDNYRQSRSLVTGPVPKMKIVRQPETPKRRHQEEPVKHVPTKPDKQRLQELQDRVNQEQSVIMQSSNALNQCCGQNMQFAGTQEAVECHKLLLIACKKREAYINEMHRIKQGQVEPGPANQGSLTISNIRLPLKQEFKKRIGGPNDTTVHYFLLLLRHKDHVVFSQMVSTHAEMVRDTLDIPNLIKFSNIQQDFRVDVEVYGMSVIRDAPGAQTPKKKKGPFTPKKLLKKGPLHMQSPGGPGAVRSTNFVLVAHLQLAADSQGRTHFMLENVPFSSPLQGSIHLRMQCLIEINVEERGFLTMFEDVSGFGAWHRRWFALQDGFVSFWKYPDDERIKEPLGRMDLKQCITDSVGLIPRDVCARPHTFELITVRRQSRGDSNSLVSRCHNTMTTTKHWLSADTKEERMLWCNRLNEALEGIRTWHAEALRPVKRTEMVTPYNPYPSKADQRERVVPFNPHDQQSTC